MQTAGCGNIHLYKKKVENIRTGTISQKLTASGIIRWDHAGDAGNFMHYMFTAYRAL